MYTAYLADSGGAYDFKLGLFAGQTNHTKRVYEKAKNEIQKITIKSDSIPNVQVYMFFWMCLKTHGHSRIALKKALISVKLIVCFKEDFQTW